MNQVQNHLDCCVCGLPAGKWVQHENRDAGYGICPPCFAEEAAIHTPEQLSEMYGEPGVHHDIPMVRHLGRRYRVLAATKSEIQANAFMSRTPNAAVLTVFDNGTIILAATDDLGEPIP